MNEFTKRDETSIYFLLLPLLALIATLNCQLPVPTAKVKHVQRHASVKVAEFDQCRFGLVSLVSKTPMKKRTRIMTNSMVLFGALDGKYCEGDHNHQVIEGSEGGMKRSQAAQVYPGPLVHTISKALLEEDAKGG